MKVVINDCHGGFGLNDEAFKLYLGRKGIKYVTEDMVWGGFSHDSNMRELFFEVGETPDQKTHIHARQIERNDPELVRLVEELGSKADSWAAALKIVEIPDDVEWQIEEYDGLEWVAEKHRTWS